MSGDDVDPKHLENALYHAKLIQQRKDVENSLLESLERLIDYPLSTNPHVESPSSLDMLSAADLLQFYRPIDFDELVDERRRADKCGYILCPRPPIKQNTTARMRILPSSQGLRVVPREKLECWCSRACARRAAYIKYQLIEEPAWLRPIGSNVSFSFPVGQVDVTAPVTQLTAVKPTDPSSNAALPHRQLDKTKSDLVGVRDNIMSAEIVENQTIEPPHEPSVDNSESNHNLIEGYAVGSKAEEFN